MSIDQERLVELMISRPREPKETLTDWFDRLMAIAWDEDKPRLPYREPGEDDE